MIEKREIRRQFLHAATALIPLLYYFFPDIGPLSGQQCVMILFLVFGGLFVFADYFRRKNAFIRKAFLWFASPFIRDIEEKKMTAASTIAMSFFAVLLLFPAHIAVPACLLLSIGDAASGIIGRLYGRHYWFKQFSIEGSLAFILAGLLLFTLGFPYIPLWKSILVVTLCALFEGLLSHLNDNFVIPVAAASMLLMLEV
jgi:dolichol kinase